VVGGIAWSLLIRYRPRLRYWPRIERQIVAAVNRLAKDFAQAYEGYITLCRPTLAC
jgi:uncharacterized membrane protein